MFRLITPVLCVLLCSCTVVFCDELKTDLFPDTDVCGKQDNEERIYGGEEAGIGEFPWMALLESRELGYACGGALINNRYVLTAAHCVTEDLKMFRVRLGEHNWKTDEDCEGDTPGLEFCSDPPVDVEIEQIISHETYDDEAEEKYGDIALLRLKDEVKYSKFIRPICLPFSSELKNKAYSGERAYLAGWGKTETKVTMNDVKLKVDVPVITNNECAKFFRQYDGHIAGSQICAGGEKGKDSCQGDSGGPMMYRNKAENSENWVCIGVVSYGLAKCGVEDQPGVYTRVTEYLPWIVENVKT